MIRVSTAAVLAVPGVCIGLALAGCGPKEDLFAKGEELYLSGQYEEAIDTFRQFLVEHPGHAGAHFYLGSSYMLSSDPWMELAKGEIETALALFERGGKVSSIARFTDKYFELRCYLELAKILFKQILFVSSHGGPPEMGQFLVHRCEGILEDARRVDPDAREVKELEQLLREMRAFVLNPQQFPAQPQAPPARISEMKAVSARRTAGAGPR
ncbi:MAG: hypothetical protein JXR94_02070 [Candidatus Hydrogenedentes bacterium]|nr:hypothetical protein [Candidatus Hydrogenedentota bacterium]